MPRRKVRPTGSSQQPVIRGPLAIILLLVVLTVVAAMVLNVPAALWSRPGLSDLQAGVLEALGLPTPAAATAALSTTATPPAATPTLTPGTTLPAAGEPVATAGPEGSAWCRVYFTDPRYPDKASDHHGGIDERLVELVSSAQRSVDVAAYELDLENVAEALLAAKGRGVAVRLVTDTDNLEEAAVQRLREGGVPVVDDQRGAIMHDKFVIVDGHWVVTGSWNLTTNCTYRNNNNAVFIESEALARNYQAEFAEMFEQNKFGPTSPANTPQHKLTIGGTQVESCFAPEDKVSARLVALIEQAKTSITFMAFSFTDDAIGQAMMERAEAGVAVTGVFERRGADTEYGEYPRLRQAGLDVLLDGNPYVMHHKVIIIDGETVVTGSFNFSSSADKDNDENVLVIHSPDVARLYLDEFQRVRQRAVEAGD